ncbi:electron transfer flavoprotein subunit beta/FixA family protein [Corynebacterium pseudodiphtheriticum]|uniref:electron transfer flavoprotein subunit beta/FixA family protein n=1 Tax=Corynebacterium pseudodiphtheriticum TaxID=37637 RepID=UPI00254CE854|nr:electron transfer flavoprotein subunit beta/FixA family protein [Corynebacterium pseudodiphtheriticum]MDK8806224.1 electron transfer flavoprotein subunit beta/FixA family protein [Corynebacterium pseudodiphtheriticum]
MRIAVLVKEVPDTSKRRELDLETGLIRRHDGADNVEMVLDESSQRAVEAALRIRESNSDQLDESITIDAISMAPEAALDSIRRALSMGADEAVLVHDKTLVGADLTTTAEVLAAALRKRKYDLIICGNESSDGASGALPAMIAEHLKLAVLSHLTSIQLAQSAPDGDLSISASRRTESAVQSLEVACPAVVSVSDAFPDPRFPNFKGIMAGKKKPITQFSLEDLSIDAEDFSHPKAIMTAVAPKPPRQPGSKVHDDGDAAVKILEYLESNKLI